MQHKLIRVMGLVAVIAIGLQGVTWAIDAGGDLMGNTLTYGMVKKNIKIGQSTQEDVVKLFGSPDNMVMRKNKEVWIYDRYRVETDTTTASGYGTIILGGGSQSSTTTSTRIKTITVIIDFSGAGVVDDFSMRVGGY
ncbi:MAG: hypothetical protein JW384_00835 [Nitrosomonadaceae bacterium]|nr:hypothetical protein [Nitrosomonadaceae bacterium]